MRSTLAPALSRLFRTAAALAAAALLAPAGAAAQTPPPAPPPGTNVSVSGGATPGARRVPDGQIDFTINVPLRPNAENQLSVTATDDRGRTATVSNLRVTQLTLTDIVQARVTSQRLTPQEVRALVAEGTINLADPDNYNVSRFVVVLTIGGQEVAISTPVVRKKEEEIALGAPVNVVCGSSAQPSTSENTITVPCGDGGGNTGDGKPPAIQIVPFEVVAAVPGQPSIPGVIIIEGRIKTLKEFFRVTLHLMNVSSLFTLADLEATLEVPDGALTHVAPAGGVVRMPTLTPGTEGAAEFVVRGDDIGLHTVTAHFGGTINSPFLPEPVPISGSASTDLEVKGPPKLAVRLSHPDYVQAGVPYDLTVEITNTDPDIDALYTSLALDIGADARLLDETGEPATGPNTRAIGDILRGERTVQTYRVLPLASGAVMSCTAAASQNITLTLDFVGSRGPDCAIGTLPAERRSADGRPTVTVVPSHNTTGVTTQPAIVALFSAPMIPTLITTGHRDATFRVIDPAGNVVPGSLQFGLIFEGTSAIFRPSSPLAPGAVYSIEIDPALFSEEGQQLASGLLSRFTTAVSTPEPDTQPPTVALAVEAPLSAASVPKGQLVGVLAESADNRAVTRVDLYLDDALVDTRRAASALRFLVNTAGLDAGSTHTLRALARDAAGNTGESSLTIAIAPDTAPPVVALATAPAVGRGAPLHVQVNAYDDGRVARVALHLDGASTPFWTGLVAPFKTLLDTASLVVGPHTLRAVATDGAGNDAAAEFVFQVTADNLPPVVTIAAPLAGVDVRVGTRLQVLATASDDRGVASLAIFLDDEIAPRHVGMNGAVIDTTGLPLGAHRVRARALDLSGNAAEAETPFSLIDAPPDTTPPAAPIAARIVPGDSSSGVATLTGEAESVEANSAIQAVNGTNQAEAIVSASGTGTFFLQIEAEPGDPITLVAIDAAGNRSLPTIVRIPPARALSSIDVSPATIVLNRATTSARIAVMGHFSDGTSMAQSVGIRFTSSAPGIASVDASGLVLPGQNGAATITVTAIGTAAPPVTVAVTTEFATITSVSAAPAALTFSGTGQSQRLALAARLSDDTTEPFRGGVSFGSQNAAIAIVDSSGLVTSTGLGSTTITIVPSGFPPIVVPVQSHARTPQTLIVSPGSVTLSTIGQSIELSVVTRFDDGTTAPGASGLAFTTRDPQVATVSAGGIVTAMGEGETTLDVTAASGLSAAVSVTVDLPTQLPAPVLERLGRTIAGEGDALVLLGEHFAALPALNLVAINGTPADVISASADRLVVRVPRGATTGGVVVTVDGQSSSAIGVEIYARRGTARQVTLPFDLASAAPGQRAEFGPFALDLRPGDALWLAGHAQSIAGRQFSGVPGPAFVGQLTLTVDGVPMTIAPSATPVDLTSAIAPGDHTIALTLEASGGRLSTHGLSLVSGPPDTGAFVGQWSLSGDASPETLIVRFTQLSTWSGAPMAEGATVGVLAAEWYRVVDGGWSNGSAGGAILNGVPSPANGALRLLTVQNGAVTVEFSDADLYTPFDATRRSVISLLEVDANGQQTNNRPIASAAIDLPHVQSATIIPAQTSALADGADRPMAVEINSVRDRLGNRVPDGARVGLTAEEWYRRSDGGWSNGSAGGVISGGDPVANGSGFRAFTLVDGVARGLYSPAGVVFSTGQVRDAVLSAAIVAPNGNRIESRPFATGSVTLSSLGLAGGTIVASPSSLAATTGDNRSIISVTGLADSEGRALPDGAMIGVSATDWYRVSDGGCCNGSLGGTILSGTTAPNQGSFKLHTVQNGGITITYSAAGLWRHPRTSANAVISLLPGNVNGIVGSRPFASVPITLSGPSAATVTPAVTATLADGVQRPIAVAVTNITDALGIPVPDGTRVALTAQNWYRLSDGGCCNSSAGGRFLDGDESGDPNFRYYTVTNGRVDATYTADTVGYLSAGESRTAVLSLLLANVSSNSWPSSSPIGIGALTVSSALGGEISATPPTLLADTQDRRSTIRVTNLVDAQGQPVTNGTRVAVTAANWYRTGDGGCCNSSLGGTILGGAPSGGSFRSFLVQDGGVEITYSSAGLLREANQTGPAVVSVLPADASGNAIGSRPLLSTAVTLAGLASATVVSPATVAPGGSVTVTLEDIRDAAGQPVPDGTKLAFGTMNWYFTNGGCCNNSAGGTISGGTPSPADASWQVFTVSGGRVSATFQAPGANNVTSVISVTQADANSTRVTSTPFVSVVIRVAAGTGQ